MSYLKGNCLKQPKNSSTVKYAFPVVQLTCYLHHMKFAQLASQNRQIEQNAQSRLCEQSLENYENVVVAEQ